MSTPATLEWLALDTWTVVVAAFSAMSCALLGTFLVLRRMSMMGDAISHAVLPGLALAFLLTGSRAGLVMLAGAGLVGVLAAALVQWVHGAGRVEQGTSMGVVFTILFALGLILIRRSADHVDLDPDCVLYGAIEYVTLDQVHLVGFEVPRAALTTAAVLVINLLFVLLLYKELKISSFDPALASALGISARLMHYLLMTLVAVTTVAAFESVGSILVIAMLIVPPAAAHLLTDRLGRMLVLSAALAAVSAGLGHLAAITTPAWFGLKGQSTSTAGMMGVVAGLLFLAAMLAGPRHGLLSKLAYRIALGLRITCEDLLGLLYRLEESGRPAAERETGAKGHGDMQAPPLFSRSAVSTFPPPSVPSWPRPGFTARLALAVLWSRGQITRQGGHWRLTPTGRAAAAALLRSHRLWETYLGQHVPIPIDHLHQTAEQLEHVTGAGLQQRLADSLGHPTHDPHGKSVPPAA